MKLLSSPPQAHPLLAKLPYRLSSHASLVCTYACYFSCSRHLQLGLKNLLLPLSRPQLQGDHAYLPSFPHSSWPSHHISKLQLCNISSQLIKGDKKERKRVRFREGENTKRREQVEAFVCQEARQVGRVRGIEFLLGEGKKEGQVPLVVNPCELNGFLTYLFFFFFLLLGSPPPQTRGWG